VKSSCSLFSSVLGLTLGSPQKVGSVGTFGPPEIWAHVSVSSEAGAVCATM